MEGFCWRCSRGDSSMIVLWFMLSNELVKGSKQERQKSGLSSSPGSRVLPIILLSNGLGKDSGFAVNSKVLEIPKVDI